MAPNSGSPPRILVVEDEPDIAALIDESKKPLWDESVTLDVIGDVLIGIVQDLTLELLHQAIRFDRLVNVLSLPASAAPVEARGDGDSSVQPTVSIAAVRKMMSGVVRKPFGPFLLFQPVSD